jgi:hypothetical protein
MSGFCLAKQFVHSTDKPQARLMMFFNSSCDPAPRVLGTYSDSTGFFVQGEQSADGACASIGEAVALYLRSIANLSSEGYYEAVAADRDAVLSVSKPDWQKSLDIVALHLFALDAGPAGLLLAPLAATAAAEEPFYLWLASAQSIADAPSEHRRALTLANKARDVLARRAASKMSYYSWSLRLEPFISDLICALHIFADEPRPALAAAEHANELASDVDREERIAWILCEYFPERREEAFKEAFECRNYRGFESIRALPGYAKYAARRLDVKGGKGWSWSDKLEPATEEELAAAERALGNTLPKDYKKFLRAGRTELLIEIADHAQRLRFVRASQLVQQRRDHVAWHARTNPIAKWDASYQDRYGVSCSTLVPVALPRGSDCIVMNIGGGDRHG